MKSKLNKKQKGDIYSLIKNLLKEEVESETYSLKRHGEWLLKFQDEKVEGIKNLLTTDGIPIVHKNGAEVVAGNGRLFKMELTAKREKVYLTHMDIEMGRKRVEMDRMKYYVPPLFVKEGDKFDCYVVFEKEE